MKYFFIQGDKKLLYESLGELYLSLEAQEMTECYVISEDGKNRFPKDGKASEREVKGQIAMNILDIQFIDIHDRKVIDFKRRKD